MHATIVSSNTRVIKSQGKSKRVITGRLAMDTARGPSYPTFSCFNAEAVEKMKKMTDGQVGVFGKFAGTFTVTKSTNPASTPIAPARPAFVPTLRTASEWLEQPYYANIEMRNTNGWTFKNGKPLTGKRLRTALDTPMTESVFAYRLNGCDVGVKVRRG